MRTVLRCQSRQLRCLWDDATSAFSSVAGRLLFAFWRMLNAVSTAAFPRATIRSAT